MHELISENPRYGFVLIDWIEETQHPEIIEKYNYKATPSMFIEHEKMYEAHLFESYGKCKRNIKLVLDTALGNN